MAWQLIYTSAPRLLEAGRSGFGSVARHRQISPLLVSAIERASQFSRQPGMDPGRVIFSHRIVPISGGRFHVLSCIRDAGADYTGRTNHIAHHVIAEAREVAQLRSPGPSAADVLLAMHWVERWSDSPRYLEAAEEVHLASFTPQTAADGAHWASVTGDAAHAWLLAAGEASRGAYIIPPPGVDLRFLIADSLRLSPERLWQTSFTTSLQSKDEISDYRWVGLESGSPLRNETSASGRPVLDLTQPQRLPIPETPPATAPIAQSLAPAGEGKTFAASAAQAPSSCPRPSPERDATAGANQAAIVPADATPFAVPRHRAGNLKALWIIVAAAVLGLGIGLGIVRPFLKERSRVEALRDEIKNTLNRSGYFSADTVNALVSFPKEALNDVKLLADDSAQSAEMLKVHGDDSFNSMASRPLSEMVLHRPAALTNIPQEILSLDAALKDSYEQFQWLKTLGPVNDDGAMLNDLISRREQFAQSLDKAGHQEAFGSIRNYLDSKALALQIKEIEKLLLSDKEPALLDTKPANKIRWFRNELKRVHDDKLFQELPQAQPAFTRLERTLDQWEALENQKNADIALAASDVKIRARDWPRWLRNKARALVHGSEESNPVKQNETFSDAGTKNHTVTPVPIEKPPLYLIKAENIQPGKRLSITQLGLGLKFFIKYLPDVSEKEYKRFGSETAFGDFGEGFKIEDRTIVFGKKPPSGEFELTARTKEMGEDVFVVRVFKSQPVFPDLGKGIALQGDFLVVTGVDSLPDRLVGTLRLLLPEGINLGTQRSLDLLKSFVDLSSYKTSLEKRKAALLDTINSKGKDTDFTVNIEPYKSVIRPHLSSDPLNAAKDKDASAVRQCGLYLHAIGTDWPDWIGSNVTFEADKIFDAGTALAPPRDVPIPAEPQQIANAMAVMEAAIRNFKEADGKAKKDGVGSGGPKKPGVPVLAVLNAMKQMLQEVQKSAPAEKARRENERERERKKAEEELEEIRRNPILNGKCPAGTYVVIASDAMDDKDVRVMEVQVK
jgi:GTPase-associated protein 1, N-terminal domain type 2